MAAGCKFGWNFTQSLSAHAIPSSQNLAFIPPPENTGSAHYIFRGHPYGSIPLLSLPPGHSMCDQCHPMPVSSASTLPSSQSESTHSYFPETPDPVELALINAAEKIANLESGLEMATLREVNYIKEISNLWNELAETYTMLQQQESRIAEEISSSYSLTQFSLPLSHCVSPFTTPSKGKNSIAQFPQFTRVLSPCHPEISMSSSFYELLHRTKPKPEGNGVMTASSNLNHATTEFIETHDLTQFGPTINLIVKNYSPTKWSSMLGILSLSDSERNNLLDVMKADLEEV